MGYGLIPHKERWYEKLARHQVVPVTISSSQILALLGVALVILSLLILHRAYVPSSAPHLSPKEAAKILLPQHKQ